MLDDGRVLLMIADEDAARPLTDFGRQTFSGLSWSPDGKRLLIVVDEWVDPD